MRPNIWLFVSGWILLAVGIALAVADRAAAAVGVLVAAGAACVLVSVLFGRAEEGTLEASGTGLRLSWKQQVTRTVGEVLEAEVASIQQGDPTSGGELSVRRYSEVHYEDINNDGAVELLVEHPVGAHSRVLKVFGWIEEPVVPEFGLISQLHCGLGGSFTVGDLDADGEVEVAMVDLDHDQAGANYASGPYVELLYSWDEHSEGFFEVDRNEIGSPTDFSAVEFKWYRWRGPVQ